MPVGWFLPFGSFSDEPAPAKTGRPHRDRRKQATARRQAKRARR